MNSPLKGYSALVTGGGGGIGAAAALLLARDGAAVTLMGRNVETLQSAAAKIQETVPQARIALCGGDAMSASDVFSLLHSLASDPSVDVGTKLYIEDILYQSGQVN